MNNLQRHRGPDGEGVWSHPDGTVGFEVQRCDSNTSSSDESAPAVEQRPRPDELPASAAIPLRLETFDDRYDISIDARYGEWNPNGIVVSVFPTG